MDDIVIVQPVDTDAELDRLARQYRAAGGVGVQLLNALGGKAEGLIDRLPVAVRTRLTDATEQALALAMRAAQTSRTAVPDQKEWVNTAVTTAMGAAGGFGGAPTALVELPVTTAMLLRSIQGVAAEHGFDPAAENVQFDCIRVFAAAGPLAQDDGADLGFVSLRLTLTGGAMQKLIATVAPRFAAVLGQKLAAQTVPVLGAVAGATANYVFTSYYQQIAHVHFGLRRLATDGNLSEAEVLARFTAHTKSLAS
ncbi:EcsC family protein [Sedimentitalea nanhaiensis]|uniref:EcsC protein family protein n=1 Tax=Sedimentitalea nanhaiensis TaxID=999627 RepID=A0A1I6ZKI0_9RHOB|nr:EcsC family protein [Sedimentitalea nanhaiensis]SFT63160.1 EcsC protein family protein [Sedimentitalea nanhaiensis]